MHFLKSLFSVLFITDTRYLLEEDFLRKKTHSCYVVQTVPRVSEFLCLRVQRKFGIIFIAVSAVKLP